MHEVARWYEELVRVLEPFARSGGPVRGFVVSAPSPGEDPRRRYYRITAQGQDAVRAEASRLERVVQVARDAAVLPQAR